MHIGIAKEIAARGRERRAILLPKEVSKLIEAGHEVFVERGLGERLFISDEEYKKVGAHIMVKRKNIFNKPVVVKLKPPLPEEFKLLHNNLLFCMLHAEQNPQYVKALKERGAKAASCWTPCLLAAIPGWK